MTASNPPRDAIGSYLELELGPRRKELYPQALALQAARSAFLALLLAGQPRRVWAPWYICETMVEPIRMARIEVRRYGLEEDFHVERNVDLLPGDWLLYVNYFGLCDAQVDATLARFPASQVVVDNSHALYSAPRDCLGTIYSPRKFVGVPDGGYLLSSLQVPIPADEDSASVWRCIPLLVRAADCAESGYTEYLNSQKSLSNQMPLRMSRLTRTFLASIDYAAVAARRRDNFKELAARLGHLNASPLRLSEDAVPLSYPFMGGSGAQVRKALLAERVYVPQYWPQLCDASAPVPPFERHLAHECIPLPCDQRYDAGHMGEVAAIVQRHLPAT